MCIIIIKGTTKKITHKDTAKSQDKFKWNTKKIFITQGMQEKRNKVKNR